MGPVAGRLVNWASVPSPAAATNSSWKPWLSTPTDGLPPSRPGPDAREASE
jgi:hypothetical protein